MIVEHWSETSTVIDLARIPGEGCRRSDKPDGFWVSVPGSHGWTDYLRENGLPLPPHRHQIELAAGARILFLDSVEAILDFSDRHPATSLSPSGGTPVPGEGIDWDAVVERWQGIIIAPFQATLRREPRTRWYYGWDCASGCIWDPAAIASVVRI